MIFKAACHKWKYRTKNIEYQTISYLLIKPNKKPDSTPGCSKLPNYKYKMVKQRRKLLKEGYSFDKEKREWTK